MEIDSNSKAQPTTHKITFDKYSIYEALQFHNLIRMELSTKYPSQLFSNHVNIELREKLVPVLNTCQCCDRHQVNRPVKYEPWVDTTFHNTSDIDCECQCRHFSRIICRTCE